ncbi:early nodulin-70-like [Cicer arietinum]|uniref:Early nodulin-70-like isoform X1 n=1 Tax=Cicer arietinum TaxID=3827 RepID=A0A1S3E8X8_CICAR|nr:early nodulin-70-like isoform X1 [Cicer arietinum]
MDLENEKNDIGRDSIALWVLNPPEPPCMLYRILKNLKEAQLGVTLFSLKHQNSPKIVFTFLQALFPIFASFKNYNVHKFKSDVLGGLILAIFAIPQAMANASLANMSPEYGLYTSIVPPLVYALISSSREIVIGPATVDSLLLSSMIQTLKDPIHDSIAYTQLVLTATFFTGVFQVAFGFFRFGFLVDYLSDATMVGFLQAVAIGIVLQQLKGLFGIVNFTSKSDLFSVIKSLWTSYKNKSKWHPCNFIIGFSFLSFILFTRLLGRRKKKLVWLSHIAPILSFIISSAIAYKVNVHELKIEDYKIEVLGPIKGGSLNPNSINQLQLDSNGKYLGPLIKIGLTVAIISTTQCVAVGRLFASLRGYKIDPNREVLSLGIMNIIGSFTSCYVGSGSIARTAVNYNAGSQTMVSSIVMALTVLLSIKFLTGLLYFTPKAMLAAIILSAVPGLIDIKKVYDIWKVDKLDFLACSGAFLGVLFLSVPMGLAIGTMISFAKILLISIQPSIAVFGRIPGSEAFGDVEQYPMAINMPGVLVVSVKSAWLCFTNASPIRERIERWVIDGEDENSKGERSIKVVIIDTSSLVSIDTAGIASLVELNQNLTLRGVTLSIANPRWQVIHKLRLANFVSEIGGRVFLSVGEAIDAILAAKMEA